MKKKRKPIIRYFPLGNNECRVKITANNAPVNEIWFSDDRHGDMTITELEWTGKYNAYCHQDNEAFHGTVKLYVPNSVRKLNIAPNVERSEYYRVKIKVIADSENPHLLTKNGMILSADESTLFRYNGNDKTVKIPDTVREIAAHAFYQCDKITEVTLPPSVEVIGEGAFSVSRKTYENFLKRFSDEAIDNISEYIETNIYGETTERIIRLCCDLELFTPNSIDKMISLCVSRKNAELTALLLSFKSGRFAGGLDELSLE